MKKKIPVVEITIEDGYVVDVKKTGKADVIVYNTEIETYFEGQREKKQNEN